MLKQMTLNKLESAMNMAIQLDPEMPERLSKLTGKVIAIELIGMNIKLYLVFEHEKINLKDKFEEVADLHLIASPSTFVKMAFQSEDDQGVLSEDFSFTGDGELAQTLFKLLKSFEVDWEEYLSYCVGDVLAHQVGNSVQGFQKWRTDSQQRLSENITEYLQEEIRSFPPREEMCDFFHDIDHLRTDVDRLQARLQRIEGI